MVTLELDDLVSDPLKALDYANNLLWEHRAHPQIAAFIKKQRAQIATLKDLREQYQEVLKYVLIIAALKQDEEKHPEKLEYFRRTFCPGPFETSLPWEE